MNISIVNSKKSIIQLVLFLTINALYILKYVSRTGFNPYLALSIYLLLFLIFFGVYIRTQKITEKAYKFIYWGLITVMIAAISVLLIAIDPNTIRVDRWSALTFFWDSIFQGKYPYATHTHVSVTNFASPFPLWHLMMLPFYLLKDVGTELIFFLIFLALTLKYYFSTYRKSLFYILLLCISPAYWWEIAARSDGMSNAWLVFIIILWLDKSNRNLSNSFAIGALICGIIASTRFSALLPLALFFFQPYLKLSVKQKIYFPIIVFCIALISFLPFIFWDTNTWIFFSRNPFMSQTGNGNIYTLIIMIALGLILALKWKNIKQFFFVTTIFIFLFMLFAQIMRIVSAGEGNLFSDAICDISYFNLSMPYFLAYFTTTLNTQQ